MDIEVSEEPARLVAVRRATVRMDELGAVYDSAYRAVAAAIAASDGRIAGPALGWYRGMPTDTTDVAAGFPVEGELAAGPLGDDGVEVVDLPGGRVATARYVGSYDGLGPAWGEVEEWRAAAGVDGRGDFWEVYVTEPSPEGDPAANETLLVLPLR